MPVDFDDMTKRILDKLDTFDNKIDDLCARMTKMESEWTNHLAEIEDRAKAKERRFYYLIAVMGVGFALFETIKELL